MFWGQTAYLSDNNTLVFLFHLVLCQQSKVVLAFLSPVHQHMLRNQWLHFYCWLLINIFIHVLLLFFYQVFYRFTMSFQIWIPLQTLSACEYTHTHSLWNGCSVVHICWSWWLSNTGSGQMFLVANCCCCCLFTKKFKYGQNTVLLTPPPKHKSILDSL